MASSNNLTFHWADYVVFVASILISLLVGVYFAVADWRLKRTSNVDFLLAGRNAKAVPVAMSMVASFLSAVYILGVPAEVTLNGTMFVLAGIGYFLAGAIGAHIYIPVFHKMGLTSAYGYLETRFNKVIRIFGSIIFIFMMIIYMAVSIYAPAIAFKAVTGLSIWITVFGIGIICTLYTTLGGMRAVIWTDTFQMAIIFIGLVVLVIKGSIDTGGISAVWQKNVEGGRIDFSNVSPDPRVKHTWWSMSIGMAINISGLIAGNQIIIQRYLSIRKLKDAQLSVWLAICGAEVILVLCGLVGLVMYAYYSCFPTAHGRRPEELVPLFMMHVLGELHGLPGLITASVFAATLSTVSSAVQALAAVFTDDILPTIVHACRRTKTVSERTKTWTARSMALFFGFLTVGLSYVTPYLGASLIQISIGILGTAGGPLFGLFTLAIFFPCANSWGAGAGLLVSLIFTFWINIGATTIPGQPPILLPRLENCSPPVNATISTVALTSLSEPGVHQLYRISYMWYGVVSLLVTVIVGLIVSALTGCRRSQPPLDRRLVFPCVAKCCCCCPSSCKDALETGVNTEQPSDDKKSQENGNHKLSGIDNHVMISTHL